MVRAMARPLRIEVAGACYHVTARGNERRAIFRDDRDRQRFLELLEQVAERFRVTIHAYVLMSNHYHLLLQTGEANLSRAMQWLGVSYTVGFNRRHRRSGHLFQGRFHAVVLEEGAAAEVSRYVHLNPVRVGALGLDKPAQARSRAGMLRRPHAALVGERLGRLRHYAWSSYRAYVGEARPARWLTCATVLGQMGGDGKGMVQARRRYRDFVEETVREGRVASPWERLTGQVLLGGADFLRRMRACLSGDEKEQPALRQLRARPGLAAVEAVKAQPWQRWRDQHGDWGRDAVLHLGRQRCGLTLRELGEAVGGLDYRSVGSALSAFERRRQSDRRLRQWLRQCELQLQKQEM